MYQTPKRVYNTFPGATKISNLMFDSMSNGTARSAGDVWDGLCNGVATGFGGDALIPEAAASTFTPTLKVAASVGADLATPVAYWFQKQPFRVRVGSVTAAAVPATDGFRKTITERPEARGIFRMGLADLDDAAQIILDQGTLGFLDTSIDFEAHFDVANVANGNILATAGFADIGIFGGAIGVDPTAVANANGAYFKITAGRISFCSLISGTSTVLGTLDLPSSNFVLSLCYDANRRRLYGCLDGLEFGSTSSMTLPIAVTALNAGARVCHLAAYAALTDAPLCVDLDGIIMNQMSYAPVGVEV